MIGTSVRTLRRRLAAEETTYSGILEKARSEMAGVMLETSDASPSDIAAELGYSTLANFSRTFSRWAGISPSRFREQRRCADLRRGADSHVAVT